MIWSWVSKYYVETEIKQHDNSAGNKDLTTFSGGNSETEQLRPELPYFRQKLMPCDMSALQTLASSKLADATLRKCKNYSTFLLLF